jgi:20S proteasome alpha/beta subunit
MKNRHIHIAAAFAGVSGDARPLVNGTQQKISQNRFELGEAPSLNHVASILTQKMQEATMSYGTRPFGVSIIVAGTNEAKPKMIKIETNGNSFEAKAGVVGKNATEIQEFLESNYNADALDTVEETVNFAIKALTHAAPVAAGEIGITVLAERYKEYSKQEIQQVIANAAT